jgi:peptidyl-prolyl cis-trans isomerase A (cyclophilin A)
MHRFLGLIVLLLVGTAHAQTVRLQTSMGEIKIALDAQKAPKTVANFLAYAKAGHYNGTVFHRVIPNFMIQGGGFTKDMVQKATKAPIPLESGNGLINSRGAVAMARTADPNSATAQFFINTVDNAFLDKAFAQDGNGYAVFGAVVDGMDVVDKIRAVPTDNRGMHANVPVTPVIINKVIVEGPKK